SRTVTAVPNAGYIFATWTENGAVVSGSASYAFTLRGDQDLVANFIPNPFPAISGAYNGLFCDETNGVSPQSCGCFTITVAAKGAYTGSLQVGGGRYSFVGQFDFAGTASQSIARTNANALTVDLQLDLANRTDRVTGSVSDGAWTSALAGDRAIYDGRTTLAPEAGSYTLVLAGAYGSTNKPAGDSYGALTVGKNGAISFTGTLADGTKVTPSAPVSKYGQWPFYASLCGGQGVLWSWLTFTNASDLGGAVAWVKLPLKTPYYPAGFSLAAEALGARYFPPGRGTNVLGLTTSTDLTLTLEGGGLAQGITNRIALAGNNRVTTLSGPKLSLTFAQSTGEFHGSVVNHATSRPASFGGVLLQGQGFGSGFFLGASGSGEVRVEP
ncbi:MAG: InlB B-repeat-containing protein, partial [Limisphaerales bacterium]